MYCSTLDRHASLNLSMPNALISGCPEMPEFLLGLDLGGQPVAVPAESPLDAPAPHRLVPRDRVLDVAGQQVPVVRQAVGERRAVVEDELVVAVRPGVTLIDRRLKRPVALPALENRTLERGEVGLRIDVGVGHAREAIDAARLGSRTLRVVAELVVGDVGTDEQPAAVVGRRRRERRRRIVVVIVVVESIDRPSSNVDRLVGVGARRLVEPMRSSRLAAIVGTVDVGSGRACRRRMPTAAAGEPRRGRPALAR